MDGDYASMIFVDLKSQRTHGLRWNLRTMGFKKVKRGDNYPHGYDPRQPYDTY